MLQNTKNSQLSFIHDKTTTLGQDLDLVIRGDFADISNRTIRQTIQKSTSTLQKSTYLRLCGFPLSEVIVQKNEKSKHSYNGLSSCKNVWNCPICRNRIKLLRKEITHSVLKTLSDNYNLILFTYTIQHNKKSDLKTLLNDLKETIRESEKTYIFKNLLKTKYIKYSTTEITYGENGFHPHLHVLFAINNTYTIDENSLKNEYKNKLQKRNYKTYKNSLDITYFKKQDISDYLNKDNSKTNIYSNLANELNANIKLSKNYTINDIEYLFHLQKNKKHLLTNELNYLNNFIKIYKSPKKILIEYSEATKNKQHNSSCKNYNILVKQIYNIKNDDETIIKNENTIIENIYKELFLLPKKVYTQLLKENINIELLELLDKKYTINNITEYFIKNYNIDLSLYIRDTKIPKAPLKACPLLQ